MEAPDDLIACYRALLESVGYWAMPNINPKTFGGKPKPVPASGVTGRRYPPLAGYIMHCSNTLRVALLCVGPVCGELSGGNRMVGRYSEPSSSQRPAAVASTSVTATAISVQLCPSGFGLGLR